MKRLFLILLLLIFSYIAWPFFDKNLDKSEYGTIIDNIKSDVNEVQNHPQYSAAIDSFFEGIHQLLITLDETLDQHPQDKQAKPIQVEKPNLSTPTSQIFSIYNIEIGDTKEDVEMIVGPEKRSSYNEYGNKWYAYHNNYQNFFMVAYDVNDRVIEMYTNQDLIASTTGINRGSSKEMVRNQFGKPLTQIKKQNVYYQFKEDQDFDVFVVNGSYVTIFYDKHQNNTVTAIQMISKNAEQKKPGFYGEVSSQLKEGFESQLFDLTNASRINHGLNILTWDEHVKETARSHSLDMAENNYFDHNNLKGQTPFDRMEEDNVLFTFAGENLAYGQFSSIFAHEGLMNSKGHRENILRTEFKFLGVGVAFNDESQPYFTENFYSK